MMPRITSKEYMDLFTTEQEENKMVTTAAFMRSVNEMENVMIRIEVLGCLYVATEYLTIKDDDYGSDGEFWQYSFEDIHQLTDWAESSACMLEALEVVALIKQLITVNGEYQ